MSDLVEDVDRHLGIQKPGRKPKAPKQAKLPGFSSQQLETLEAAIEAYQATKDRMDAAVAQHKEALQEATEELVQVMHDLKRKTVFLEGIEVSVFDLVKLKVKGRKSPKSRDGEDAR